MPVQVFCSYSHADDGLRRELEKHLDSLRREGLICVWSDRKIRPGDEWSGQIDGELARADIVLLLISADFLASDYCMDVELRCALDRHARRETRVVPIMLRPADWENTPLGRLQALPGNGRPVTEWPSRDEAFKEIAVGIRAVIAERDRTARRRLAAPSSEAVAAARPELQTGTLTRSRRTIATALVGGLTLASISGFGWFAFRQGRETTKPVTQVNETERARYARIPAGSFERGCRQGTPGCREDETPARTIRISTPFWLRLTLVTVGEYRAFTQSTQGNMPPPPPFQQADTHPITNVTWHEANRYCEWAGGRLPTEAEWEYASRAGREATSPALLVDPGWYGNNSGGETHRVMTQPANRWGLFDMMGNVWEWCADWYAPDYYKTDNDSDPIGPADGRMRVLRGGSWQDPIERIRVTVRSALSPDTRQPNTGFRCVLESMT